VGIEGTSFDHYADSIPSAHASEVPLQLREGWLRFHEAELCQGVDAVFVFHKKGMEVWCRVEDEKNLLPQNPVGFSLRHDFCDHGD